MTRHELVWKTVLMRHSCWKTAFCFEGAPEKRHAHFPTQPEVIDSGFPALSSQVNWDQVMSFSRGPDRFCGYHPNHGFPVKILIFETRYTSLRPEAKEPLNLFLEQP